MTITLAFYKGRAAKPLDRLKDAAICFATRGKYSHVEMIEGAARHGETALCLSASGRDGGVRGKAIYLKPASWDLVELRIDSFGPAQFIRDRIGAKYDFLGILLSHVLPLDRHDPDRWFCSEIIGGALGLPEPHRLTPQLLFDVVVFQS